MHGAITCVIIVIIILMEISKMIRLTYRERDGMSLEELAEHLKEIDKEDTLLWEKQKSLRDYEKWTKKAYDLKKRLEEEKEILKE